MNRPWRQLPSHGCLVAFESAARHNSFTHSAAELHLTQGAVSHNIRQLEELLGVSLFERIRQRVVLTPAGARYLADVRKILAELGEVTHRAMASGDSYILNLGVTPSFTTHWLIPKMNQFFELHPDIKINFLSRSGSVDFSSESLDAAIHYGEPTIQGAVADHLLNEYCVPACSPAFKEKYAITGPAALVDAPLLQQFTRPSAWADWFRPLNINSEHAFRGQRFDNFSMIACAAKAGLGAGLLPRFVIEEDVAQGRLEIVSQEQLQTTRGYYFVFPEEKKDVPTITAFRGWLLGLVGKSPGGAQRPPDAPHS